MEIHCKKTYTYKIQIHYQEESDQVSMDYMSAPRVTATDHLAIEINSI